MPLPGDQSYPLAHQQGVGFQVLNYSLCCNSVVKLAARLCLLFFKYLIHLCLFFLTENGPITLTMYIKTYYNTHLLSEMIYISS